MLVLGGAWFVSRALSETPPPAAPQSAAEPVAPALPPKMAVMQRGEAVATPAAGIGKLNDPRVIGQERGGGLAPSGVNPAKPPPGDAPVEEEPNPFVGESRELDYADKLMFEGRGDGGTERLMSAREVYQRCVESVGLQRCKDGIAAVDAQLSPPKPTAIAPLPTLGPELGPVRTLPRAVKP